MNPLRLGYSCNALLRTAAFSQSQRPVDPCRCPARAAAFFHTSRHHRQISRPERYGTAKKPPPHLQDAGAEGEHTANAGDTSKSAMEQILESSEAQNDQQLTLPTAKSETAASSSNTNPDPPPPSESVLNVDQQDASKSSKPPHLEAPPYVHHFDTWTLVRDLQNGGFSQEQAITIMKAVRLLLANNMDLAREALVSKSNVENVRVNLITCPQK
jgi:Protein of unknown function (DUF1640)